MQEIWDIITNMWDPKTNPEGYVSLGLAENSLMHNELSDFLNSKRLVDDTAQGLTYGEGPQGSKRVKAAIASFLSTHFRSTQELKPENIFITNGVSSAIEHCAWTLANPGEGILLGRPYYRAFLPDIGMRTGVQIVPVAHLRMNISLPPKINVFFSTSLNLCSQLLQFCQLILGTLWSGRQCCTAPLRIAKMR